jgi:phenylacetate-CoA ligase
MRGEKMKRLLRTAITGIRGSGFKKEYHEIKKINSKGKLLEFQEKYLTKLLLHTYENVPYYHSIFREIGVINDGTVDLSKFNQIPILTKEIMRKHHKELISKDCTTRKWYYNSSGGSTGEPTRFIQDDLYGKWGNVTFYYYYKDLLGIDEPSVKKIILWGSEKDLFEGGIGLKAKIINWLTNTIFLNSFRMTEENMKNYIKTINAYKPDLIMGYAGSLYELCRYAERKNMVIYTPKIVVSAAETLRDEMRREIETIFKTKMYDYYGSRETNNLAGECKEGLMHVLVFHNYIEVLNNHNQPVKEGEEGRVIVTNLHNYSMPFIRYEIGDMAVLGHEECGCGNVLPTLKKITGRVTDHFLLESGTTVPAEFFIHLIGVVCNRGRIKKFQVVQEDYNKLKILVVSEGTIDEHGQVNVEDKIKLVMGPDCKIVWEFVEDIPKTKSGKYLYTRSLIWR